MGWASFRNRSPVEFRHVAWFPRGEQAPLSRCGCRVGVVWCRRRSVWAGVPHQRPLKNVAQRRCGRTGACRRLLLYVYITGVIITKPRTESLITCSSSKPTNSNCFPLAGIVTVISFLSQFNTVPISTHIASQKWGFTESTWEERR